MAIYTMSTFGLGVIVHIVLLLSIFDIHFKTPILRNLKPVENDLPAPAKRLVLFSGDGIRADTFYTMKNGKSNAPFLRSIVETTGMWGISNAHVPTESRPGHVAIIAGMYEDPSAIFKGWQNYVVDFDTIFNQSYASFSWGSPDILHIFSRGSKKVNSFNYVYSSDKQQFSGTNDSAVSLTYWVADQFDLFLNSIQNDKEDAKMYNLVNSDKIVFFFHFLGTDIAGHTAKPHSQEYLDNVLAVDKCVERIQNAINYFFNDDKTAFVFTSDHGMTDWGSHGDGTPEETLTPVVTWGAGLNAPIKSELVQNENENGFEIPDDWNLSHLYKMEIDQADITPLMAVLIGISIPVNSVGILPIGFLRGDLKWTLNAIILNIHQLKAQYDVHHDYIKSKLFSTFYEKFEEPDMNAFFLNSSSSSENSKNLTNALNACTQYLRGIEFYRNYFSTFLLGLLSLLYIGWILNLGIEIISRSKIAGVVFSYNYHYVHGISRWDDPVRFVAISATIITLFLLICQGLPVNFYVYSLLTIAIWWSVVPCWKQVLSTLHLVSIHPLQLYIYCILFFFGLELLVMGFKWRSTICIAVLGLQFLWIVEEGRNFSFHRIFTVYLITSCVVGVFPLLPTVGAYQSIFVVFFSGILWFAYRFITAYIQKELRQFQILLQLILIFVASFNALIVDRSFSRKYGLYLFNQIISWVVLVVSIVMLKFGPKLLYPKYIYISSCLSAPFILLTSGHEAMFLCLLSIHLFIWTFLEFHGFQEISKESYDFVMWGPKALKYGDFRIAFFFFTYCLLGFFGIGNFASLNSFDPIWVRGFITMFSPFTMMLLILFKTIIPIFIVTCALRVVLPTCQESVQRIFLCVLLFCDIVGLNFFLTVTNQGSWMQIGTSLSKFILLEVLTILLLALYALAVYIMPIERDDKEIEEFPLESQLQPQPEEEEEDEEDEDETPDPAYL